MLACSACQENTSKSKYKTFEAFEEDVRLLVYNAQTYNHPGDPVYNMAGELLHDFLEWLPMVRAPAPVAGPMYLISCRI
jgi:hypothetical protein